MHSYAAALHRTIMAVDVAGYSNPMRTLDHQAAVHAGCQDRTMSCDTHAHQDTRRGVVASSDCLPDTQSAAKRVPKSLRDGFTGSDGRVKQTSVY